MRTITQGRDDDERFPELGKGGSFYLQVNGRDFLVRGATYTPDLLYRYDPDRDDAILAYARDLGLNMLRLESKIPAERFVERGRRTRHPAHGRLDVLQPVGEVAAVGRRGQPGRPGQRALTGRRCCARTPRRSSGPTPATAGHPQPVLDEYHRILRDLHWQNAVVDTVSSYATDAAGERVWDGIQMAGPYTWRPPTYWFSGRYRAARGASAEQGDNEHIPPFASLTKFIPPDKLWPINDYWYFHAGSNPGNAALSSIRTAIVRRYGSSSGAEEFARKAQLAHYESTRAQFESFAALGWAGHKMTIYWMLNSHWPSFFGNIFDYYLRPGRRVLRSQEGAAAAVGRVRLLRDGGPQPGQRDRGEPDAADEATDSASACASTTCRAGCVTTRRAAADRAVRWRRPRDDAAQDGPRLAGVLRPVRAARQRGERRSPRTSTGSRNATTTSEIPTATSPSSRTRRAGPT